MGRWLYREQFRQRYVSSHYLFSHVQHNLCEYGSLRGNKLSEVKPQVTRTSAMEKTVLDAVQGVSIMIIHAVAAVVGVSRNTIQSVLRYGSLSACHLQWVQSQFPAHYLASVRFTSGFLENVTKMFILHHVFISPRNRVHLITTMRICWITRNPQCETAWCTTSFLSECWGRFGWWPLSRALRFASLYDISKLSHLSGTCFPG